MEGINYYPGPGVNVFTGCQWHLRMPESDVRAVETAAVMDGLRPRELSMPDFEPVLIHPDIMALDGIPMPDISMNEQVRNSIEAALEDQGCLEMVATGLHEYIQHRNSGSTIYFTSRPPTHVQRKAVSVVPAESLWSYEAFMTKVSYLAGEGSRLLVRQFIAGLDSEDEWLRANTIAHKLNESPSYWWQTLTEPV